MAQATQQLEEILDRLVHDVESSVHAFYRGDHQQHTAKSRSDHHRNEARDALLPLLVAGVRPGGTLGAMGGGSSGNAAMLSPDEVAAVTRCIMGWLPMGVPGDASPQSRCVAAAKELLPSWGEREKARLALKRAAGA
ncbi:MAG TPA: hypothetical protein VJU87_09430 [Gemmatimonadaceae bacterium]|nr:hypothetical protein [Gemmatimonadaceae bacterium]